MMTILHNFFSMHGYGFYIWCAYAIALMVLIGNVVWPLYKHYFVFQNLKHRVQHNQYESKT